MEHYSEERSKLFIQWSTFSCPDSCERMGCQEPCLHVSISLVDLVALSLVSGQKKTEIFRRDVNIAFDPVHENEPWIGQVCLELKKPCHIIGLKDSFLKGWRKGNIWLNGRTGLENWTRPTVWRI